MIKQDEAKNAELASAGYRETERCHEHSLKDWDRFNSDGMTCYSHGRKSMVYDMNIAKEECHE